MGRRGKREKRANETKWETESLAALAREQKGLEKRSRSLMAKADTLSARVARNAGRTRGQGDGKKRIDVT